MTPARPRYVVIAQTLENEVKGLSPNSLLPTEDQMARRFSVSRITIRSALELLENSGLISRLRGRGTIVSPKKLIRSFSPFMTFEADMRSQGVPFTTQVLDFRKSLPGLPAISAQLGLQEGSIVARLSLVRLVNDLVICHDHRYYPEATGKLIDPELAARVDCSDMLEAVTKKRIRRVAWESEIMSSSEGVASALGIANRTLVFTSNYTWYDDQGIALEAGRISYRVDRCKFQCSNQFLHLDAQD